MDLVLLIRSLERGGTERQVVTLAQALRGRGVDVCVLSFYPSGDLREALEKEGVSVISLNKRGRWDFFGFFLRLWKWLRKNQPKTVYSFLTVANILSGILKLVMPNLRVIWGVRGSSFDLSNYDWLVRASLYFESKCARFADVIIANSEAGRENCIHSGFPARKIVVIENGIDTSYFRFSRIKRREMRSRWKIRDDMVVIGMVARVDPIKGHETFLEAAAKLVNRGVENVCFVLVGSGNRRYFHYLKQKSILLGIEKQVVWAGEIDDIAAAYSAFDIATSSSYSEGFSNAIAEAMACECLCVVTDVGDSARIIKNIGWIVPAHDSLALMEAWLQAMSLDVAEKKRRKAAARERIKREFSINRMVDRTCKVIFGGNVDK